MSFLRLCLVRWKPGGEGGEVAWMSRVATAPGSIVNSLKKRRILMLYVNTLLYRTCTCTHAELPDVKQWEASKSD